MGPKSTYTIGSLQKALEVLDCFSDQDSWSLAELTARRSLHKATVYRILHTFEELGYLTRQPDARYRLGMRLFALGNAAVGHENLRWQSLPPLQDLAEATGETVYVGILYEGYAVCVQVIDGRHEVRMHAFVGKRSPAHASALGKMLLCFLPDAEVDAFLKSSDLRALTENTITDPRAFKDELRRTRDRGYALDDQEMEMGLRCIGAPISDFTGRVIATVSLSGPSARITLERVETLVPLLKGTAQQISRMLGSPSFYSAAARA